MEHIDSVMPPPDELEEGQDDHVDSDLNPDPDDDEDESGIFK